MLVRQAADYFVRGGYLLQGGKQIPVNLRSGILNAQAAIARSAASGLLDILDYAKQNPQTGNFFLGDNGSIDTINSVVLLSRSAVAPRVQRLLNLRCPSTASRQLRAMCRWAVD